jgi:hypothetical protein
MANTSSPSERSSPRRRQLPLLAAAVAALVIVQLSCRSTGTDSWRPYQRPGAELASQITTASMVMNANGVPSEDGSCVGCHQGCSDPHPGGRVASCTFCHGGDATKTDAIGAHPKPKFPAAWKSSANPEQPYMLTMQETEAWVRFVNPGDLRVANQTCGPCHADETLAVMKSLMTTAQHFWGTATYANGIVSVKRSILGESYGPDGTPQAINHVIREAGKPDRKPTAEEIAKHSYSELALPLPHWEVTQPGNVFRIFEKGSRLGTAALGQNGLASPIPGLPDKFEDPGRPNNKSSDRGLGTLNRVDLPTLNVHKTRLNDPHLSFFGTNDQPGDYRSSGCTACHVIYANDRDPVHSGPYAQFGNVGHGNVGERAAWMKKPGFKDPMTADPTIPQNQSGHPIAHRFTRAIPSSTCMVCHMHQPNSFVNTYYGYQMWSYETDGQVMFPKEQRTPSHAEARATLDRNPEGAVLRGKWADRKFLDGVASEINPQLQHTQFADYHGHGWIFRAVFKTDRKGNLLDKDGKIVPYDKPDKFAGVIPPLGQFPVDRGCFVPKPGQPVHLKDIHAEVGMHCVDCHFAQDVHGDTHLYAEYQAAIQIQCQDCHGTATELATLRFSGPAAKEEDGGSGRKQSMTQRQDRADAETPWGKRRFEVKTEGGRRRYLQRSMLYPDVEWEISQVKNSCDPGDPEYNEKAAYAKLQQRADGSCAHDAKSMDCAACHTAWMTSCFGCHLPQEANWRTEMNHFEAKKLRNWASYNPQVARDDVFMLGISPSVKDHKVAAVRSSSAVMISSTDAQRAIAYKQQLTVAANGMNGQCFNTHFAHTVRKTETRKCSDCHLSEKNDNNAWLAQTLLMGTNYVNFFGMYAYVGEGDSGLEAVKITEWPEPQAVIGSNLHRMAFPDEYKAHEADRRQLDESHHHGGSVRSLEVRGEYLYTASGSDGFRVYDIANIANKNFSERIVTAPVSPFGQDTHVRTRFATAVALPTNLSISMARPWIAANQEQNYPYNGKDQNLHESYRYAYISDRFEGLIVVDIDCLTDGDPDNNFFERAVTFNPDGALAGAEHLTVAGTTVYVCCRQGLFAVDISDPRQPKIIAGVPLNAPRHVAVQFRYAFVTDADGLHVVDITTPTRMQQVQGASVPMDDARSVYLARTYAYVAAGKDGMAIVDIETATAPKLVSTFTAEGAMVDVNQIKVGMVNDSVYGLVADGKTGLHVLQLVTPEDGGRSAYGFAPEPRPKWIASKRTKGPALAIAKGLDRDRAVDEAGHQVSVFGRIGGRPFKLDEMQKLYMKNGKPFVVPDAPPKDWRPTAPRTTTK